MSLNVSNEDLRRTKTKKALYDAMFSLLKSTNFKKITIKKICEEALISRATFYAHFIDKYDLLYCCIPTLLPINFGSYSSYEQAKSIINNYFRENIAMLENLFYDSDHETVEILFKHILSTMDISAETSKNKEISAKNVVLSNFYAGGMIHYLLWQIEHKFPPNVPLMNKCLYEVINEFRGHAKEGVLR